MNLRKKFLTACLLGSAVVGFASTAEAQITTTTNRIRLVNGANSLTLMPPASGGSQTLTFPDMSGGGSFIMSTSTNGQTITSGAGTALTISGDQAVTGTQTITGAFTANGGATITGAASIAGGLNNNGGGITQAGDVSGVTSLISNTGDVQANLSGDMLEIIGDDVSGENITMTMTVNSVGGSPGRFIRMRESGGGKFYDFALNNTTNDFSIINNDGASHPFIIKDAGGLEFNGGVDNNAGGLTEAGAISGVTTFNSTGATTLAALNTAGVVHNTAAGLLSTSLIVNADVDAAAAIVGTKISPDFGTQAVTTSGNISTTGTGAISSSTTVTATGAITGASLTATTGDVTATLGNINAAAGDLQTGGVTRIEADGDAALQATTAASLTVSGATNLNGSATIGNGDADAVAINTTGNFSLASSGLDVSTAGAVSGATTIDASGIITGSALTATTGDVTATLGNIVASAGTVIARAEGSTFGPAVAADGAYVAINGANGGDVELAVTGDATVSGTLTATLAVTGDLDMNAFDINDLGDINFINSGVTGSSITKTGGANLTIDATGGDLILTGDDVTITSNSLTVGAPATFNSTAAHGANQVSGSNFVITGGSINSTPIGAGTPSTAAFTTLASNGGLTVSASGASITGGIDNNAGGITEAGAVSSVSSLAGSFSGRHTTTAGLTQTIACTAVTNNSAITLTYYDPSGPAYDIQQMVIGTITPATNFTVILPFLPEADHVIMYTVIN